MKNMYFLLAVQFALSCFSIAQDEHQKLQEIRDAARSFLISNTNDPEMDFEATSVLLDDFGQAHVRLAPIYGGYPVYGDHFLVHLDHSSLTPLSMQGNIKPPQIELGKQQEDPFVDLDIERLDYEQVGEPMSAYFVNDRGQLVLTLLVEVTYTDVQGPQRDQLFFNPTNGALEGRLALNWYARNRETYSAYTTYLLPGAFKRGESTPPVGEFCVDSAHDFARTIYDYFYNVHGRDSIDNGGMTMMSVTRYRGLDNAYWQSSSDFLTGKDIQTGGFMGVVYGEGVNNFSCLSGGLDIAVHEFSHGLTSFSANLNYSQTEPGALNEATSDIFAAAIEASTGANEDKIWKIGEAVYTPNTPSDAIRYMNKPTLDSVSKDYYPERYLDGHVHHNSGIANLFFYLLARGGSHPRGKTSVVVPNGGIGITAAAKIWYRALTVYMTPTTDFNGARSATLRAAADLYGWSSTQYTSTDKAWQAVGVVAPSNCNVTTNNNGLYNSAGTWRYFYYQVPSCATRLDVDLYTLSKAAENGNANLYVRYLYAPTSSQYDARSTGPESTEHVTIPAKPGTWVIGIYGQTLYYDVNLTFKYQ